LANIEYSNEQLKSFLAASLKLLHAKMGNVQVIDDNGCLRIATHHGFRQPFLDFFKVVTSGTPAVCGAAETNRKRVIVEDVTKCAMFVDTPALRILLDAGVRAVQSTPLMTRSGEIIGVISTHYPDRFIPSNSDLQVFDLLVRDTVDRLTGIDGDFNELSRYIQQQDFGLEHVIEEKERSQSKEELESEIADISADIDFLELQVRADMNSYSADDLSVCREKIDGFKRRLDLMKREFASRT